MPIPRPCLSSRSGRALQRAAALLGFLFVLGVHAGETGPANALTGEQDSFAPSGFFPVEQDDIRPADQLSVDLFGRTLVIGGEFEFAPEWELGPELDDDEEDDVLGGEEHVALEFLYKLSARSFLFVESEIYFEDTWFTDNDRDRESKFGLSRKQHWLFLQNLGGSPFSLQIGRQNIAEKREWWWDEDLDGIRLYYDAGSLHAELMLAEEIGPVNTSDGFEATDQDIRRLLGQLKWQWAERHRFEAFLLDQRDHSRHEQRGRIIDRTREDTADGDLTWFGLRQSGSFKIPKTGRFYYWADTALVEGEETAYRYDDFRGNLSIVDEVRRQEVAGWAFDVGLIWRTKLPNKPTLTLGLAAGSGDSSPDDNGSHAFLQTGLNDNNGKFRGVDRFRYYGEFLRPELSNLAVSTLAVGTPILENSSIELIYHRYRQLHAADFLRDAKVDTDPDGRNPEIGDAIDFVVGIEESAHYEFEFVIGAFRAGDAFEKEKGKVAGTIQFKLNYNF